MRAGSTAPQLGAAGPWRAACKKSAQNFRELGSSMVVLAGDSQPCKVTAVSSRGPAPTDRQYEDRHCRYRVPEPELVFDATYRLLKRRPVALATQQLQEPAQTYTSYRLRQGLDDSILRGLSRIGASQNKSRNTS